MKNSTKIVACLPFFLLSPAVSLAEVHIFSSIPLVGTEEVPALTDTGNFGAFTGIYDDESNRFYYSFSWSLESAATAAHFHGPAERGENADIQIDLGPVSEQTGTTKGAVTLTDDEEAEMLDGLWYVNVHSENHGPGAIRGQVKTLPPGATSAIYDSAAGVLSLHAVTGPRLGVFEVEMHLIEDRDPLSLEIGPTEVKDLDAFSSSSGSEGGDGDPEIDPSPY